MTEQVMFKTKGRQGRAGQGGDRQAVRHAPIRGGIAIKNRETSLI